MFPPQIRRVSARWSAPFAPHRHIIGMSLGKISRRVHTRHVRKEDRGSASAFLAKTSPVRRFASNVKHATARIGEPSRRATSWQADEGELATAKRVRDCTAIDMGDVEVEAGLWTRAFTFPSGPGRIESIPNARCLLASHSVAATFTPELSLEIPCGGMFVRDDRWSSTCRPSAPHAALHSRLEIGRRNLGARAMCADRYRCPARCFLQRILVDGYPLLPKCRGASIWVPAWSHRDEHRRRRATLADWQRFFVVFQTPCMTGGWPG